MLTNIARHSGATKVKVNLKLKPRKAILTVKDNGRGIADEEIVDPSSFGIFEMRERALEWGGKVTIKRLLRKGTAVTAIIPLEKEED